MNQEKACERWRSALSMHRSGIKAKEIGERFEISSARVYQILARARREERWMFLVALMHNERTTLHELDFNEFIGAYRAFRPNETLQECEYAWGFFHTIKERAGFTETPHPETPPESHRG